VKISESQLQAIAGFRHSLHVYVEISLDFWERGGIMVGRMGSGVKGIGYGPNPGAGIEGAGALEHCRRRNRKSQQAFQEVGARGSENRC
jgi:hypothetical protein